MFNDDVKKKEKIRSERGKIKKKRNVQNCLVSNEPLILVLKTRKKKKLTNKNSSAYPIYFSPNQIII